MNTGEVSDASFLGRFEACTWPIEQWHHRQHIRVAYLYLLSHPLDAAMDFMRERIRAYNAAWHIPDEPARGYHETMTRAWLQLVHVTLSEFGPAKNADAFMEMHTHLLAKRVLLYFYTRDLIMSPEAKQSFVPPDLAPLPVSRRKTPLI